MCIRDRALLASAAILFLTASCSPDTSPASKFVKARGTRFVINGKPFRFVGANVAVMYRDEDRELMPETLRQAAQAGIKVVSYTHLRAHETPEHLVCRLLLEKKKT